MSKKTASQGKQIIYGIIFLLLSTLIAFSINLFSYNPQAPQQLSFSELEESSLAKATFAGGCFWCTESDFEKTDGVIDAISGFAGGEEESPSYKAVASGQTSHREAVTVYYNPQIVSYQQLLEVYWRHIDPTDDQGQFVDRGFQYSPAIFYRTPAEKRIAENSQKKIEDLQKLAKPINTPIIEFSTFYPAEDYHQNYHIVNPLRYQYYRSRSGRDTFIQNTWQQELKKFQNHHSAKKYSQLNLPEIRNKLTELEFKVTQEEFTEPPFNNKYWDNKEEGIYVDIVSGEPLFSSTHKFDSGTGWPSFYKPLVNKNIVLKNDYKLVIPRIEVRSKHGNSHLGHLFKDGLKEYNYIRYCINSAALKFIPKNDLKTQGYSEFLYLFEQVDQ